MNVEIPVVRTERLTLRAHRPGDFPVSLAMWTDPEVTRFIGGQPSTEQQAWTRVLTYIGHWAFLGFGYWAIEETETGAFVGDLGFADFHRNALPAIKGVPELGWAIATRFRGRGYATEAARAALAWGDAHFKGARTVCMIDAENAASIRVAQKCGYREFHRAPFNGKTTIFFERAPSPST